MNQTSSVFTPAASRLTIDDALPAAVVPVFLAALDDAVELAGRAAELILAVVEVVERLALAGRSVDRSAALPDLIARRVVRVGCVVCATRDVGQRRDALGVGVPVDVVDVADRKIRCRQGSA